MQEVFSDVGAYNSSTGLGCLVNSGYINCYASDFTCGVNSTGRVFCDDKSVNSGCTVEGNGKVDCTKALGMKMNSAKSIVATSAGVMFKRSNGNVYFIGANNWSYEKEHLQEVFSDVGTYNNETGIGCYYNELDYICFASDFQCAVHTDGYIGCRDKSDNSYCSVSSSGTINCS